MQEVTHPNQQLMLLNTFCVKPSQNQIPELQIEIIHKISLIVVTPMLDQFTEMQSLETIRLCLIMAKLILLLIKEY